MNDKYRIRYVKDMRLYICHGIRNWCQTFSTTKEALRAVEFDLKERQEEKDLRERLDNI